MQTAETNYLAHRHWSLGVVPRTRIFHRNILHPPPLVFTSGELLLLPSVTSLAQNKQSNLELVWAIEHIRIQLGKVSGGRLGRKQRAVRGPAKPVHRKEVQTGTFQPHRLQPGKTAPCQNAQTSTGTMETARQGIKKRDPKSRSGRDTTQCQEPFSWSVVIQQ